MTESNYTQLTLGEESSWEGPLIDPRMRKLRFTDEGLTYTITKVRSDEIRSDRQTADLVPTEYNVTGPVNIEWSFGEYDELLTGAFASSWDVDPFWDNDGVEGSSISDVSGANVITVADESGSGGFAGTAVVADHIVKLRGFVDPANNQRFTVVSSTSTSITVDGPTVADANPGAYARLKVVGFAGAAGDLAATATGLQFTLGDFTAFGLRVGQWVKIGGADLTSRFDTAENNNWARITDVKAKDLTLDHLPSGWSADVGAGKTIKVWTTESMSNGVDKRSWKIEKGFLEQDPVNYIPFVGLRVDSFTLTINSDAIITGSFGFAGKEALTASGTPLDPTPLESQTYGIMNSVTDVGAIYFDGAPLTGDNLVFNMTIEISNNVRNKPAVGVRGGSDRPLGRAVIAGDAVTYFDTPAIWNTIVDDSRVSLRAVTKEVDASTNGGPGYLWHVPSAKMSGEAPAAGGSDQDVVVSGRYEALIDPGLTGKMLVVHRSEWFEETSA